MKKEIVFLSSQAVYADTFTTSDVIAEYAGITHHAINVQIWKHFKRIERAGNGKVSFKMTHSKRGQKRKTYLLTEEQATLLITFLKNTEKVADFKENLVHQFFLYKKILYKKQVQFELGKQFSKDLHQAIAESPHLDEHHHLYGNINKLIYQQALGVSTKALRQQRHIPKSEPITHYFDSNEAGAVKRVKEQTSTLLGMHFNYQQIKGALQVQGIVYQITLPAKKLMKEGY
ncbi:Rha family transcriptional regulator [Lentilactobacillus hilgardii]|uniref:Rha family transcriptional regulator n=1 Tax=Lentilactobacillus hilgardii TaxID=1588 RepID=UPI0021C399B9|nr:Rha family transcriptional regulator [Lentilactobacillus hilgardii]MCP9334367.1 Rha family transcriptional regulator [Lentilactobacillus hilgardii]MCP9350963.1 Rha family transcriptional regulator [Lentilactobacillus hilgardii]MCP9353838.1 Rha family transcriptional regulator [Lentilactobacillus hilgardii]